MKKFKIQGDCDFLDDTPLFWSNELGWVYFESATVFEEAELENIMPPSNYRFIVELDGDGNIKQVVRKIY